MLFTTLMATIFLLPDEKIEENVLMSKNIMVSEVDAAKWNTFFPVEMQAITFYPNIENVATSGGKFYYGYTSGDLLHLLFATGNSVFDMFKFAYDDTLEMFNDSDLYTAYEFHFSGGQAKKLTEDEFNALDIQEKMRLILSELLITDYGLLDLPTNNLLQKAMVSSYPRYWHGSILFTRPLLLISNIAFLRTVTFALALFALAILVFLMSKRFRFGVILSFSGAFALTQLFILPRDLTFFHVVFITLATCCVMLWKYEKIRQKHNGEIYFFFVVAALTAFFDTLTVPLLTLLIPLSFYILLELQQKTSPRDNFFTMAKSVLGWSLGYGLLFVSKWAIATVVIGENIFVNAMQSVNLRVGGDSALRGIRRGTISEVFRSATDYFTENPFFWLSLIALIVCSLSVYNFTVRKKNLSFFLNCAMLLTIAAAPFMWYAILKEHSLSHVFMTYRLLAATVFALGLLFIQLWSGGDSHAILQSVKTPNPDDTAEADEIVENSVNADIKQVLTAAKAGVIKFSQRFKTTKKPPSKNPYAKTAQKGSGKKKKKKR
ncbi:MAG: hypothetical protein FWG82_03130 [Oscillospiraceae bacterium]|nr:hypothetical protein [Oscillospiraceae bacterium]